MATEPKRILVVEDEPVLAVDLEDMLHDLGAVVIGPVASLQRAIQIVEEEPMNGAVLDINIGGDLVFPLADRLTRKRIPFIFCTSYAEIAGALDEYEHVPRIGKPYREENLRKLVITHLIRT